MAPVTFTRRLSTILFAGCLSLFFLGSPAFAVGSPHGYSKGHGDYGQKGMGSMGHGYSHHGKGSKGHGYGHSKGSPHGSHGYSRHMGPHATASQFIQHVLKFKQAMAITDDQENKLRSINTDYKKTKIKMKAEVELANLDLHELLRNENADLSDIEKKLKDVHELKAELYMASIKARREAKAVLTDEQRKRMKAVHDRIKAAGSGSMSHGHPGGYKHHGKDKEKKS